MRFSLKSLLHVVTAISFLLFCTTWIIFLLVKTSGSIELHLWQSSGSGDRYSVVLYRTMAVYRTPAGTEPWFPFNSASRNLFEMNLYLPLLLTAPLPFALFMHRLFESRMIKRRRVERHCLSCGYDIRATPERCPECGEKPSPGLHQPKMILPAWAAVLLIVITLISMPLLLWWGLMAIVFWDFRVAG